MNGVLVVDKPAGMTSHDVVDRVRKVLGTRKVGHAGTLDPEATGVLVVGVGTATRLLDYAKDAPKRYTAVASFGTTTTTQDATGEVIETRPIDLDETKVQAAIEGFRGPIEQIPPMVSAVKIGGERLYKKARRGEEVDRPSRTVTIYSLELVDLSDDRATLDVTCSAGTYIRTLVHDLGEVLGCGAHMASLRRTEAAGFGEGEALGLDELDAADLRPLSDAVRTLHQAFIDDVAASLVKDGRKLPLEGEFEGLDGPVALIHDDDVLAIYRRSGDELVAEKVLPR